MPSTKFEAVWAEKVAQVKAMLDELGDLCFEEFGLEDLPELGGDDASLDLGERRLRGRAMLIQVNAVDAEGNNMCDPVPILLARAVTMEARHIHQVRDKNNPGTILKLQPGPSVFACIGIER